MKLTEYHCGQQEGNGAMMGWLRCKVPSGGSFWGSWKDVIVCILAIIAMQPLTSWPINFVDWEMRGSRGIEFGVDLPALPALGLGSSPHPTSVDSPRPGPSSAQAQGDGWGFGEWTRFVGAWKKSKHDNAAVTAAAATVEKTPSETRERERREDENALKASTDKISMIFDWLTERVPAPTMPSTTSDVKDKTNAGVEGSGRSLHTSGVVDNVGERTPLRATPSEMKQRMDREDKRREKKRELANRQDLERFYIALARKMYDAGL